MIHRHFSEKYRNRVPSGVCYLDGQPYSLRAVIAGRICASNGVIVNGKTYRSFMAGLSPPLTIARSGLRPRFYGTGSMDISFSFSPNVIALWVVSFGFLAVPLVEDHRQKTQTQTATTSPACTRKIQTLPAFGYKIAYLRKIDPFTFEELLLEGFESHGFRTIRNKRHTGDGGIDGR